MTTSNTSHDNGYLLLFRGNDWPKTLSPEQMQGVLENFMSWFEGLQNAGKIVSANPLQLQGKIITGANGANVTDCALAESKEAVGGYFLLKDVTYEEAIEHARQCPTLAHGATVEVRPVAEVCPLAAQAGVEMPTPAAAAR